MKNPTWPVPFGMHAPRKVTEPPPDAGIDKSLCQCEHRPDAHTEYKGQWPCLQCECLDWNQDHLRPVEVAKRRRGRPRKIPQEEQHDESLPR